MLPYWHEALFDARIPVPKIGLVQDNPIGIENAAAILPQVGAGRDNCRTIRARRRQRSWPPQACLAGPPS